MRQALINENADLVAQNHRYVTVSVIAAAKAASTSLPPYRSIRKPAWLASGCEVATMLRAKVGTRRPE